MRALLVCGNEANGPIRYTEFGHETITATVVGNTATGTITFRDGTTTLGTSTLNGSGVATFTTTTLALGTHSITAVYGGDTNFTGGTSIAFAQTVVFLKQGQQYTIRGREDDLVTQVIHCLAEHRIRVIDFRTELPTLEDVFLKLTGHTIRD